ncbi:MAG TPA: TonB-dependent receptor [Caulobacteraceae bacterium]
MRFQIAFAALVAAALPHVAAAQESGPEPASIATSAVVAYPPAFFASAQPNTAMDMINRLPGFTFDGGDSVRGFSGAAGNVLIDGERPATKSDDLESVLRRVPASQIERIEVIRGGAPGIDMQGKTVLANVVRKKGDSVTGLVAVANTFVYDGRQTPAMRLEGTRRGKGRTLEGSFIIAGFYDDGAGDGPRTVYDGDGDPLGRWRLYTEGDGTQAVGTAAYEMPLLGGKARINGRAFYERFWSDEAAHGIGITDGLTERDDQKRLDGELGLSWGRELGPRTTFDLIAIQQINTTDLFVKLQAQEIPNYQDALNHLFLLDRTTGESVAKATLKFKKSANLSLESGVEGAFNGLDGETSFTEIGDTPDPSPVRVEELRGEVFTQGTWTATPRLTVEGGFRMEASRISADEDGVTKEKTLYFPKPRAVVTWSPNTANQIRLRVEREVGQLNFDDFVAAVAEGGGVSSGNTDIEPEQAWVAEAAYERRFWGNGSVVLTVRHFEITDVIDRAPDITGTRDGPANIGDGTRDELGLELTLPVDKLGLKGGVLRGESTWRRSEVIDPTTGEERQITAEHPVDWEAHYTQGLPRWKATWGVDVYGAFREPYYRFNEVMTVKLRTFVVPYIEFKPRPDIAIRFDAQNATSRDNLRYRDVYDGPRDVSPLLFHEEQVRDNKTNLYVRIRKTLG